MKKYSVWIILGRCAVMTSTKKEEVSLLRIQETTDDSTDKKADFHLSIFNARNGPRYAINKERDQILVIESTGIDVREYVLLRREESGKWLFNSGAVWSMKNGWLEDRAPAMWGEIIFDSSNILDRILRGPLPSFNIV